MWQSHDKPSDDCNLEARKPVKGNEYCWPQSAAPSIPANGKAILSRDNMAVMVPTWLPASLDAIDDHDFIWAISRTKKWAADAQQHYSLLVGK